MQCRAYKTKCPECGYIYKDYERTIVTCPECGGARIPCNREAVGGYNFCKFHGGPNPANNFYGLGGARMSNGAQSHFEITRLAAKYNEMQAHGRHLSNQASLAILRARIQQLADRIDMNEAPDRMAKLQALWTKFREHENSGEKLEAIAVKAALDAEFEAAYHDYAAWKQMFEALDLDRKLVESEVKIAKDIQAILTAEDAYKLTAKLLAAIISTVGQLEGVPQNTRAYFLKRIEYEFTSIIGDGLGEGSEGSGGDVVDSESGPVDPEPIPDTGDETRPGPAGPDEVGAVPE